MSLWPSRAFADSAPLPFSDAHGHFFNASDLPIAGFAKYTLMPEWLGNNPSVAAIVDFLAYFVKPLAKTAEWEADHLGEPEEWTWLKFGRDAARFVYGRINGAPAADLAKMAITQPELASSYQALRTALIADAGYPLELASQMLDGRMNKRAVDEIIFTEVAKKVDEAGAWGPGDVVDYNLSRTIDSPLLVQSPASVLGVIARIIGWAYLMLKRRESHLKEYVARNGASGYAPSVLINHLVDYDLWLNDAPDPHSSHRAQVEFWNALATKAKDWSRPVGIRTFAGFCPLKLAIARRAGRKPWFEDLKDLRNGGKITGFKLYPPMGFQPFENSRLQDQDFDSGGIFRVSALDKWQEVAKPTELLGPKLDGALIEFYDYCAEQRVPIMAHARRSNNAGPDYERRADPHIWERVVRDRPLRLLLGHMIGGARKFVDSSQGAESDDSWRLDATIRMLSNSNFDTGAQVYGDLGYMADLIGNRRLASDFFKKLKSAFGDSGLKRICYGTDWIMLAREKNDRDYLSDIVRGMKDAGYTDSQQADILENNVRRFLGS